MRALDDLDALPHIRVKLGCVSNYDANRVVSGEQTSQDLAADLASR
jgi:hypothetical protein